MRTRDRISGLRCNAHILIVERSGVYSGILISFTIGLMPILVAAKTFNLGAAIVMAAGAAGVEYSAGVPDFARNQEVERAASD